MAQTEQSLLEKIEKRLSAFECKIICNEKWYFISNDQLVHICALDSEKRIVIEYADGEDSTLLAEDGESFYISDFQNANELISEVISEIEEETGILIV